MNAINEMSVQKVRAITAKRILFELNLRPLINIAWTARIGIDNGSITETGIRAIAVLSNGQKRPKII